MRGGITRNSRSYYVLALMIVSILYTGYLSTIELSAQMMSMVNNAAPQQHAEHTFDNLIISENIPLNGQLTNGDYILLMDFTPFATSVEGHSHIALKVPCNVDGSPKVTTATGIAPKLNTLDVGRAINNGTLNGKALDLSYEGKSCLYHAELPTGIAYIALINTSNSTLDFDGGKYSATVSAHGTAIQHIGSNQSKLH